VPLGSLSRTLDLLDRESLVKRGERGDVLDLDWEGAIRRWAQDYAFLRSNRTASFFHPGDVGALSARLVKAKLQYAVTGRAAQHLLLGTKPPPHVSMYVEDLDLAAERLGLQPTGDGTNVVLAEPYGSVVFERIVRRKRAAAVTPSQAAADLLTAPGTDSRESDELLDWMRSHEDQWRVQ
jgi:hypothetical protein